MVARRGEFTVTKGVSFWGREFRLNTFVDDSPVLSCCHYT